MPSSATTRNRLEKQGTGENTNTWGSKLNATAFDLIDEALDGYESIAVSGNLTLTATNYTSDQARKRFLKFTGSTAANITLPAVSKLYFVWNATTQTLVFTTGGATTASVVSGAKQWVVCDGSGVYIDTSAASAASSATAAASSASAASTSATNAASSATAAGTSATNAATSATNAAGSATTASGHATAASGYADDASDYADAAAASASAAAASAASSLPSQTGNSGKFLTTNGTAASWADVAAGGTEWTLLQTTTGITSQASVSKTGLSAYNEILIGFSGLSHNNGSASTFMLSTSENNGSSYGSATAVSDSLIASQTLTGGVHVQLAGKFSFVAPAGAGAPVSSVITQNAKADAIKLSPLAGNFDAGTVWIYGR